MNACRARQLLDRLGAGQAQAHERSPAGCGLGGDAAAVLLDHLAHDRQAEPRAGAPAGLGAAVEAVEDVRQVLGEIPGP